MISLIFDTETTGMALWKPSVEDPKQPGIVEIAWELYCDEREEVMTSFSSLIDCGIPISEGATKVHGISDADVGLYGMPIAMMIPVFLNAVQLADRIVCHNVSFDELLIRIELHRLDIDPAEFNSIGAFCTMKAATPILKLPGNYGHKWPTLKEAYCELVNKDGFEGAHRALFDVVACRAVMIALDNDGGRDEKTNAI